MGLTPRDLLVQKIVDAVKLATLDIIEEIVADCHDEMIEAERIDADASDEYVATSRDALAHSVLVTLVADIAMDTLPHRVIWDQIRKKHPRQVFRLTPVHTLEYQSLETDLDVSSDEAQR